MSEAAARFSIEAIDNASDKIEEIGKVIENVGSVCEGANTKSAASAKDVALAFNNIATAGMGLYNAIDNVSDANLALDKANIQVKTTTEALEAAQKAADLAVMKYGADSEQAKQAQDALSIAVDKAKLAVDRQGQASENVSKSMMSGILTVIPTMITLFTSLTTVTEGQTVAQKMLNWVMDQNPVLLVVAAIAALVGILVVAYNTCEPFRNAINAIGNAIVSFFRPAIEGVTGVIEVLGRVWESVSNGIKWVWDHTLGPIVDAISSFIGSAKGAEGAVSTVSSAARGGVGEGGPGMMMGSRQFGGPIYATGPYILHAGEYVLPRGEEGAGGGGGISVTFNNYAPILDRAYVDHLTRTLYNQLSDLTRSEVKRTTRVEKR